jgi:hypothetical protein
MLEAAGHGLDPHHALGGLRGRRAWGLRLAIGRGRPTGEQPHGSREYCAAVMHESTREPPGCISRCKHEPLTVLQDESPDRYRPAWLLPERKSGDRLEARSRRALLPHLVAGGPPY